MESLCCDLNVCVLLSKLILTNTLVRPSCHSLVEGLLPIRITIIYKHRIMLRIYLKPSFRDVKHGEALILLVGKQRVFIVLQFL